MTAWGSKRRCSRLCSEVHGAVLRVCSANSQTSPHWYLPVSQARVMTDVAYGSSSNIWSRPYLQIMNRWHGFWPDQFKPMNEGQLSQQDLWYTWPFHPMLMTRVPPYDSQDNYSSHLHISFGRPRVEAKTALPTNGSLITASVYGLKYAFCLFVSFHHWPHKNMFPVSPYYLHHLYAHICHNHNPSSQCRGLRTPRGLRQAKHSRLVRGTCATQPETRCYGSSR